MVIALGTTARLAGLEVALGSAAIMLIVKALPFSLRDTVAAAGEGLRALRRTWSTDPAVHRVTLGLVLLLAVALRLHYLDQPMRYDESTTFLRFAFRPFPAAISDYSFPNNHIFHTLLVWLVTRVLGNAPWAIRLPALAFGLLLVPATYVAGRVLAGRRPALFAAALCAVWPWLVLFSTNARGYTLIALGFVVLILLANRLATTSSPVLWIAFGLITGIGMFTAPVMLYPAGAAAVWILVERERRGGRAATIRVLPKWGASIALAGLITVAGYLPVLVKSGADPLVGNRFVTPVSADGLVQGLTALASSLPLTLGLDISAPVAGGLLVLALLAFFHRGIDRGRLAALGITAVAWCVLVLLATRRVPPTRVGLFLVPLCCINIGAGAAWLTDTLSASLRLDQENAIGLAALVMAAGIGWKTFTNDGILASAETGAFRDAPDVASYLLSRIGDQDRVVVLQLSAPSLDYYLLTRGGHRLSDFTSASRQREVILVVNDQEENLGELHTTRRDVPWEEYERPTLLRAFPHSSVFILPARQPGQ